LYLYQSNRLENLFTALCETITVPLGKPLTAEVIVVQNPGMARWLSQHIALETGIAANLSFPLPASFIWNIFAACLDELPDMSTFDRTILLWRILAELEELLSHPAMAELADFLKDDPDNSKRFQLAGRISDLFDQYLVYRPKMLLDWERGRESHWQAVLWQQLTSDNSLHRAALLQQFITAADGGSLSTETLPERVCFFGINSLAPAYLEVLERISRLMEVHLFQLSPCRLAWDDILPERLLAIKRKSWRSSGQDDISDYFTSGNPLLASMGMVGKEFFSQLMQLNPLEVDLYQEQTDPDRPASLLAMIQNDILDLEDRGKQEPGQLQPDDASLRFHSCHSPMREIQVLHDRLLDLFAADPALKPADILIMAPDINLYAPAVAGVFGSARDEQRIPWSIADRSRAREQPVIDGFAGLLSLVNSRFTAPEVVEVLDNPVILDRFGLTGDDLAAIRLQISQAGIRWGLDSEQRRQQGLDDSSPHTWQFGLERLLLGYVTGSLPEPVLEILPCSGQLNDSAAWLGGLTAFIHQLQLLRKQCQFEQSPQEWSRILLQLLMDFFADSTSLQDQDGLLLLLQSITDFADSCEQAGFEQPLSLPVIRSYFEQQLAEPAGGQAFLSGRVTFCNMVPMRSVPFKVIWLLGMNDTAYPRSQRPADFDLMAKNPSLGDRSRRDDDRYLFLEAILSARSHLSISWVGQSQQDNSSQPPSVLVAELQDYINRGWQSGEEKTTAGQSLTTQYPLQPFSKHCFDGSPATASHAAEWLPAQNPADDEEKPLFIFSSQPLPKPAGEQQPIGLDQLARFWNQPVRYFLSQRLGLQTWSEDSLLPESETFSMDFLQKYQLSAEIVSSLQAGQELQEVFYRCQAAGELPGAEFGSLVFQDMAENARTLAAAIEPFTRKKVESLEVNLLLGDIPLTGWLSSLYSSGRVTLRTAKVSGKDRLQLWLHHLVLLLLEPKQIKPVSIHAGTDTIICFQQVDEPEEQLAALLHYYQQGLLEPLHFYPKTSYAWAETREKPKGSAETAMKAARKSWFPGYHSNGEEDDQSYRLALPGQDPLDERFTELAALLAIPIVEYAADCPLAEEQ
jgi:exodeoxyribonuclease V gamma subunit